MPIFHLRLQFDPAPDHRTQLAAYPADDLWPDVAVLTSGAIAIDIGHAAVAYEHGRLVPRPAGSDDAAVWLPDYLGGFLPRLAEAVLTLAPDHPTTAHLLDAPAALTFQQADDSVEVRYWDRGEPAYSVAVTAGEVRAAVAGLLACFLDRLLALNPRLAEHSEIAALLRQQIALAASLQPRPVLPFSQTMRRAHAARWQQILAHPFVTGLGDGTLPPDRYRFYLAQDYVFLIEYARVLALAISRARDLETMARLSNLVHTTLTAEMALHRATCAAFGISPAALEATRPTPTTVAYTRFLLDLAQRTSLAELVAALLPCQCGYAEIARQLAEHAAATSNPYDDWIAAYTSAEYQELAAWLAGLADQLAAESSPTEQARMADAYVLGLQYEAAFWQMALQGEDWPLA